MGGCMIGECEICGEQMDEDDYMFTGRVWHHETCKVAKGKATKFQEKIKVAEKLQDDLLKLGIKSIVDTTRGELVINIADNLDYQERSIAGGTYGRSINATKNNRIIQEKTY